MDAKTNQSLLNTEARFKSLFEDSPIALWEEDFSEVKKHLDSVLPRLTVENVRTYLKANPNVVKTCVSLVKIIDVNNETLKLHQPKTKEELLSANLDTLLDDESAISFVEQLVAVVSGSRSVAMDTRIKNSVYGDRDIHLKWIVMRGYEDTLERVIIATEDITANKEYERIISQAQQKIEALVNSIDGILWECHAETFELEFMSSKSEEILGYTPEEWAADVNFWENHIHPDDRERCVEILLSVAKEKKRQDFEYRMFAADGSILWIRDFINVNFVDGNAASLRGIMIDITKNKEAEQDLNNSLRLVTEQKKRLMNFSYIVSHNLRSHTANIQSITALIENAESDMERNELVGILKIVSGSLNETILHLNDLVNIQANVTLMTGNLNLRQYIENTLTILSEQIAAKHAIIENMVPDITIKYNHAYLESILLNLISNALRYSDPARIPKIRIQYLQDNGDRVLDISDNGIGIDLKKNGSKVFGMYKTFNGNADARGIGLFMTQNQVEAMGGKISVDSEPGVGTTFKISFK